MCIRDSEKVLDGCREYFDVTEMNGTANMESELAKLYDCLLYTSLTAQLKSPRQLTIVLSSLKETACSANAFSERQRTGNVTAVNTREAVVRVKLSLIHILTDSMP